MRNPTKTEIEQAKDNVLRDVIAPGLQILFCGINPGLYSAAVGHHFARPGNRFWPALAQAGLTPRRFAPAEDGELVTLGYGLTNIAPRATSVASELSDEEIIAGKAVLERKVLRYRPRVLAVLGVTAYRIAFAQPNAALGAQRVQIGGTRVWVLPNPSGLNAHCTLDGLAEWFRRVQDAADTLPAVGPQR